MKTLLNKKLTIVLAPFILFTSSITLSANSQSALYFTHTKVSNLKNLETTNSFKAGDTIYGVLYVNSQNSALSLDNYTENQNGNTVVPIVLTYEANNDKISFYVPLSSGVNKPKKSGLMGALNDAVSNTSAFYFQVLPTSNDSIGMTWTKFLANLYSSSATIKTIQVIVGPTEHFYNVTGEFNLDCTGGPESYSSWTIPYKEAQERKETDSIQKRNDSLDETEKEYPPSMKSKINDPKLEKEIINYFNGDDVLKVYIMDAENTSTFDVVMVVKNRDGDRCTIVDGWLERKNPYGDLIKFDVPSHHAYHIFPLRCEKLQEYLK